MPRATDAALKLILRSHNNEKNGPLALKRFPDGLTPGAKRARARFPHDAELQVSGSSSSKCKVCTGSIPRGELRVALFLQCHIGYKDKSLTHGMHVRCFPRHPEAYKLQAIEEINGYAKGGQQLAEAFESIDRTFTDLTTSSIIKKVVKKEKEKMMTKVAETKIGEKKRKVKDQEEEKSASEVLLSKKGRSVM
jgi:hypothetical protein